jgi:hypothetical protein
MVDVVSSQLSNATAGPSIPTCTFTAARLRSSNRASPGRRVVAQTFDQSTAAEVVAGVDLGGRRAIVTGGASGIGIETARVLAGRAQT